MQEKIVALATGTQKSAVAILRMSGSGTKDALKGVFSPFPTMPNYLQYGKLNLDGLADGAMLVYFDAPKSYTGEEMAELHIHGSMPLITRVLQRLFSIGFRMAQNGEFTKRAFINGKTNLSRAEGLADLINAESFAGLRASVILAENKLGKRIDTLQSELTDALARLEATLDYPEEDLEETEFPVIERNLMGTYRAVCDLLATSSAGKTAKEGVNVAIVGDTNVGKSSLLNSFVGYDRAIVSSVRGTTRDTIEESVDFKGIKINFIDTAGQRETTDEIEKIGVQRAKRAMERADLVLVVTEDGKVSQEYLDITSPKIIVKNKADLSAEKGCADILISAKTGENVEKLLQKIFDTVGGNEIISAPLLLTSQRQIQCLQESRDFITNAIDLIKTNATADLVADAIKQAWLAMGRVTGKTDIQTVVDTIFEKFCLGK